MRWKLVQYLEIGVQIHHPLEEGSEPNGPTAKL